MIDFDFDFDFDFSGVVLEFELGWCFWLVLTAGSLCLMLGVSISVIDLIYPHKFSTVLEMDYGTPFDRQVHFVSL